MGVQCTKEGAMDAFITINTLYLHIKYPFEDIFDHWYESVNYLDVSNLGRVLWLKILPFYQVQVVINYLSAIMN